MRMKKLSVGLDWDDVLGSFNEFCCKKATQKYGLEPPLTINEIRSWEPRGDRSDLVYEFYKDPDTYQYQPLLPGAREFILKLMEKADVYIVTAVAPEFMSYRIKRIHELIPEIPMENIIMGYHKDLIHVDVILDDGQHNILASPSAYPVLLRKPWNRNMTGCLAVNSYEEFLQLIDTLTTAHVMPDSTHKLLVLVGPSGSGKTELQKRIIQAGLAVRVKSDTTRKKRFEGEDDYHYISEETFLENDRKGVYLEKTAYAGNYYASSKAAYTKTLQTENVVVVMDICGAIAMKRAFPEEALTVFVKRQKEDLVRTILKRDVDTEEKVRRILSLDDEARNEDLCDATVDNTGSIESAVKELTNLL